MGRAEDHLARAIANEALAARLEGEGEYAWAITVDFYAAAGKRRSTAARSDVTLRSVGRNGGEGGLPSLFTRPDDLADDSGGRESVHAGIDVGESDRLATNPLDGQTTSRPESEEAGYVTLRDG